MQVRKIKKRSQVLNVFTRALVTAIVVGRHVRVVRTDKYADRECVYHEYGCKGDITHIAVFDGMEAAFCLCDRHAGEVVQKINRSKYSTRKGFIRRR